MAIAPTVSDDISERAFEPGCGYDEDGYIVSDGEPMAESPQHLQTMNYSNSALDFHFRNRPDVLVGGNNFIHYAKGQRNKYLSPDCYVVFGVDKRLRDNYKVWEEGGHAPAVVFEFTSKETQTKDTGHKLGVYQNILRVPEYILFDPKGEYLTPRLQGYRLNGAGLYEPIALTDGRLYSEQLGLYLVPEGERLRFIDGQTGEFLRTYEEAESERIIEKGRAEAGARARREMEKRFEAERSRAEAEQRRAAAEIIARQEAEKRFEAEVLARQEAEKRSEEATRVQQAMEAEIAQLRAALEAQNRPEQA